MAEPKKIFEMVTPPISETKAHYTIMRPAEVGALPTPQNSTLKQAPVRLSVSS